MKKQVILINKAGQRQAVDVNKFAFTYPNGAQIILEVGQQWHEAGITLRSSCDKPADELNTHLILRPNGSTELYCRPRLTQSDPELIVKEIITPETTPNVFAILADGQSHLIDIQQIVIFYENGVVFHLDLVAFPVLARGELLVKVSYIATDKSQAPTLVSLLCEPNDADSVLIKAKLWEPNFACHTGKCSIG